MALLTFYGDASTEYDEPVGGIIEMPEGVDPLSVVLVQRFPDLIELAFDVLIFDEVFYLRILSPGEVSSPVVVTYESDYVPPAPAAEDFTLTYRGLEFGEGSNFEIVNISGFDLPALRTSDAKKTLEHGEIPGLDFIEARVINLSLEASNANLDQLFSDLSTLDAVTVPGSDLYPLSIKLPYLGTWETLVRCRRRSIPITQAMIRGIASIELEFRAPDPLLYSKDKFAFTLYANTPGNASNAGTMPTRPTLKVLGPLVNPIISNLTTGETLSFNLTLADGQALDIFPDRSVIFDNDKAYRFVKEGSVFPRIMPGDNQLQLSGSGASANTCMFVDYASARA